MKILIFDTETNDKAKDMKLEPKDDLNNYPYVLQLAAKLIDVEINEDLWLVAHTKDNSISSKLINFIDERITPYRPGKEVIISEGAFNVHGITFEDCNDNGINIIDAITTLQGMMSFADIIICHNVAFDKPVVISEALRLGLNLRIRPTTKIWCSMLNTTNICNIPSVGKAKYYSPIKWPSLAELYKYLFNKNLNDIHQAHDAMGDVNATEECILELLKRNPNIFNETKQ